MPSMTLVPVDHEPDFGGVSFVSVDHNPFSANGMIEQARGQLASQPERFPTSYGNPEGDQAAMSAETYANPYVKGLIDSMATLPRRAIENSQQSLDTGNYDPGPTLEAATLPMGTGAIAGVPVRAGEAVLGAGPIRAYHGSPHDFDAFDISKIGMGEGAQAYGQGLYFAENEGVARQYEKALSAAKDLPSDVLEQYFQPGQIVKGYSGLDLVKKYDPATRAVTVRSVDRQGNPTQDLLGLRDRMHTTQPSLAELNQAFKERGLPEYKPGHMYEVGINADPAHFLDWDKPLAAQSDPLKTSIKKLGWDPESYTFPNGQLAPSLGGPRGQDAYRRIGYSAGPKEMNDTVGRQTAASDALREAGIPGIKYLDQGSRAAGDGSRNYVVFNDKLINIVRKYAAAGIALPPAIAAEYAQQFKPVDHDPFAEPPSVPLGGYTAGLGLHP